MNRMMSSYHECDLVVYVKHCGSGNIVRNGYCANTKVTYLAPLCFTAAVLWPEMISVADDGGEAALSRARNAI